MKKASDFIAWLIAAMLIIAAGYFAFPASAAQVSSDQEKCQAIIQYADVVYDMRREGFGKDEVLKMDDESSKHLAEEFRTMNRAIISFAYTGRLSDQSQRTTKLMADCLIALKNKAP